MITTEQFIQALSIAMSGRQLDTDQRAVVESPIDEPLIVVAGAGSGKTTAITARALKMVFVEQRDPGSIVLTTFTKKAAEEIRSRVLGWGFQIKEVLLSAQLSQSDRDYLTGLDINRFVTGTLDSLAEQVMSEYRSPGSAPSVVLDEFIADSILLREGLFQNVMWQDADLLAFADLHERRGVPGLVRLCRSYFDRFRNDNIDINAFSQAGAGEAALVRVFNQYTYALQEIGPEVMDFAGLEYELLQRLEAGSLDEFKEGLSALLVDEFQDTNVLQESIYYELARAINGAITVVGDDDQALYRFRGGTVELFRNAQARMQTALGIATPPVIRYLTTNYRSPGLLVQFNQDFADLDPDYQPSRVAGKPRVQPNPGLGQGLPVLGIFRDDLPSLARDITQLIDDLFNGPGISLSWGNDDVQLNVGPESAPGDCAYVAFSVRERTREFFGQPANPRLPLLLRQEFAQLSTPIQVFNPRGETLALVQEVQQLCGLILECIDPGATAEATMTTLPTEARTAFGRWRQATRRLIGTNPQPNVPSSLGDYVTSWQARQPQIGIDWPPELPLIDLCYQLLTWIPRLQDEPEQQIYLEVIARAITQTARLNSFRSRIVRDTTRPSLETASVVQAIRNIFAHIAVGDIRINEEILETFPRNAVNFLTAHQAKGLEFPVVIVDVGAHFRSNHWRQRSLRFPDRIGETHRIEDMTRTYGGLQTLGFGPWRDRAFDDLTRLHYVAYSRAQALLVLVGLRSALPDRKIPNVALGWTRTGVSTWRNNNPFLSR